MSTKIRIEDITLDPRLQVRAKMDFEAIDEYAEHLDSLPPCKAVRGDKLWLTGGWHRLHAHKKAGIEVVPCEVTEGTFADAVAEAAGENADHGLRRSDEDKKRAVRLVLGTPEHADKSDRLIAEICRVGHPFVAKIRAKSSTGTDSSSKPRVGKDKKKRAAPVKDKPAAGLPGPQIPDRFKSRGLTVTPSANGAVGVPTWDKKNATYIVQAVQEVFEALQQALEGSQSVFKAELVRQKKKLGLVADDIELFLNPDLASAPTKEQRNELFDAVVSITGSDPKVSGSHVAKVVKLLLKADPPYSAADVLRLPEEFKKAGWKTSRVTVGMVEKYIGWVRNECQGSGLFDGIKEFLRRHAS